MLKVGDIPVVNVSYTLPNIRIVFILDHCSNNECNKGPMPEASSTKEVIFSLMYILFVIF